MPSYNHNGAVVRQISTTSRCAQSTFVSRPHAPSPALAARLSHRTTAPATWRRPCFGGSSPFSTSCRRGARRSAPLTGRRALAASSLDVEKMARARHDYWRHRTAFLAAGALTGVVSCVYMSWKIYKELGKAPPQEGDAKAGMSGSVAAAGRNEGGGGGLGDGDRADDVLGSIGSSRGRTQFDAGGKTGAELAAVGGGDVKRKVVVYDAEGHEVVPTGSNVVTSFPRLLRLPVLSDAAAESVPATSSTAVVATLPTTTAAAQGGAPPPTSTKTTFPTTEYTLVGLGLRTVTWLRIPVYMVGFYVATADVAALQAFFVRRAAAVPMATTLVSGEKDDLKRQLLGAAESTALWEAAVGTNHPVVVAGAATTAVAAGQEELPAFRSAFRICPVRDTDLHHIRDGFFRAVVKWGPQPGVLGGREDAAKGKFGDAVAEFRTFFKWGRMPKKSEMVLMRDRDGSLNVLLDDGKGEGEDKGVRLNMGRLKDPRIARALWMNFLAGDGVASEQARESITEGILEFVERPVGTVAAQVIPVVA